MRENKRINGIVKIGFISVLSVMIVTGCALVNPNSDTPHPEELDTTEPIVVFNTIEEMETCLDYDIPVLDKDIEDYIVVTENKYPVAARIIYQDGSIFNMEYNNEEIVDDNNTEYEITKRWDELEAKMYTHTNDAGITTNYTTWEDGKFSYSLEDMNKTHDQMMIDVQNLMKEE